MNKINIKSTTLFPSPVVLIGTKSKDNQVDIATFAWTGIVNSEPPMIGLGVRKQRLTYENIILNNTFSVNIPSANILKETDYCGMKSGKEINKVEKCKFNIIYKKNNNVPLIQECIINMECKVYKRIELPSHDYFISEIVEYYINENLLNQNKVEYEKLDMIIYLKKNYRQLGKVIGEPYKIGNNV